MPIVVRTSDVRSSIETLPNFDLQFQVRELELGPKNNQKSIIMWCHNGVTASIPIFDL